MPREIEGLLDYERHRRSSAPKFIQTKVFPDPQLIEREAEGWLTPKSIQITSQQPEQRRIQPIGRKDEWPHVQLTSHESERQPVLLTRPKDERLLWVGRLAEGVTSERDAGGDTCERRYHEAAGLLQEVGSHLEIAEPLLEQAGPLLEAAPLLQEVGSLLEAAVELAGSVGPGIVFESIMAWASTPGYLGQSTLVTLGDETARLETDNYFAKGDVHEIGKAVLAARPGDPSLFRNLYSLQQALVEATTIPARLNRLGVQITIARREAVYIGGRVGKSKK